MRLTDTHCHFDLEAFDADRSAALQRAQAVGVTRILIPALTLESSRRIVSLAQSAPPLYAAIGVHPNEALTWQKNTLDDLRYLAQESKVVAIGEIGLDYYWHDAPPAQQQSILQAQMELAAASHLPIVLHCRDAENALEGPAMHDLLNLAADWVAALQRAGNPLAERPGVFHSFSGSLQMAEQAIQLGFYIGVTGPVTFKNARQRQEMIRALPLERLLIETDAPFLSPHPHRGQRNEPARVALIAGKIAELKTIPLEEVAHTTSANARHLFSWGD